MDKKSILFVDDEKNVLNALNRAFYKENYNVLLATNAIEGFEMVQEKSPDIIISDQQMPVMTGVDFLKKVRKSNPETIRILLTGYADLKSTISAINEGGIYRYISKPWDDDELRLIVKQAFSYLELEKENKRLNELTIEQNEKLKVLNRDLEKKVFLRTRELSERKKELEDLLEDLEEDFHSFIRTFMGFLDLFNPFYGNHSKRVAVFARLTAKKMNLPEEAVKDVEVAAMLHDMGMIGLPEHLSKIPFNRLNHEDKAIFLQHPIIAESSFVTMGKMKKVAAVIRAHHEHYDGSGFPDGLKREEIPMEARIVSVADCYDEIKHLGVFKEDMVRHSPSSYLNAKSGTHFDPEVVKYFQQVLEELKLKVSGEKEISVYGLEEGMVIARDIVSQKGIFLVAKDTLIKKAHIEKIRAFNKISSFKNPIFVYCD